MNLCPRNLCQWYGDDSKYGRKCYYDPQCWRGVIDQLLNSITILKKLKKEEAKP